MTNKPLYLIVISFLTSVATALCAGDVIAQSQVNVTHFVNRTSYNKISVHQDDSFCAVDSSKSDQFFIIDEGMDIDVKYDTLDKQMRLWESQLTRRHRDLDPELCCYSATYIRTLRDRVEAILKRKRKEAIKEFGVNTSADVTTEFRKLKGLYDNLNKYANEFFSLYREDRSLSTQCQVDRSKSDQFFKIENEVDIDIKYDTLDMQMKLWDMQLEKVDENLDPEMCCYTGTYIRVVRDRLHAVLEEKRRKAVSTFGANTSAEVRAEFKKLNMYYKQLNNRANMFLAVNRIHGNPKWYALFFPARRKEEAAVVYQKYGASLTQVGTNIAIYGWENKGTINPEIVSTFFGPFRFAINTLLTSVDGDSANITEAAQLRTLTGNGGNLVASFYYPIHHYSNSWLTSLLQFSPKFATELPILNSPFKSGSIYANGNIGIDLSVNARLGEILGGASLFVYARPSWVIASEAYRDALQVEGNFWLLQPVVGIDIPYLGKIAFNFPVVSDVKSLTNDSYLLSFTVSPQNLMNK